MRTTITIDDKLYSDAVTLLPAPVKPSELIGRALVALIRAESIKHLISMGGQSPDMTDIPRGREPLPG